MQQICIEIWACKCFQHNVRKGDPLELYASALFSNFVTKNNPLRIDMILCLLTHRCVFEFFLAEKVSHFRWRKTRKTRHSFALFLQERWIRVEWDFMISLFRLHKKTWRRHQPRWDEIAERRPLDLVAAPTFPSSPTYLLGSSHTENEHLTHAVRTHTSCTAVIISL